MEVSFEGIGQTVATFMADAELQPGMAVALTADSTVGMGEDGDMICGVVLSAKNGMAAVQVSGMAKVGYSGTAPKVGFDSLGVDGAGKIKSDVSVGISYQVVSVNTADSTAVIKL